MHLIDSFDLVTGGDVKVPFKGFVPELRKAASAQFPLEDILAHVGVECADTVSLDVVMSHLPQSLNAAFEILKDEAFDDLQHCSVFQAPFSLDAELPAEKVQIINMKVQGSDERLYFCANISAIRDAVAAFETVLHDAIEPYALALQKALVSSALQNNYPVRFVGSLIEDADNVVIGHVDCFLRARDMQPAPGVLNDLAAD